MTEDKLPPSLHFVGIAGIGMSGVAQAAAACGVRVSGSDRALHAPENARIFDSLRSQGIRLYEQDGSVFRDAEAPAALVYSTAIEEDNPDFRLAPPGTPRLHRSESITAILRSMPRKKLCAVSGTSGKTTVSAWLTEALYHLGADPGALCGGLMNCFSSPEYCGNFRAGEGDLFVIEADESDKSLLNYTPESALLLNIGADHYSREELADVFARFLRSVKGPSVIGDKAYLEIGPERLAGKDITLFSADPAAPDVIDGHEVRKLHSFHAADGVFRCSFGGSDEFTLPVPGFHSALNALAVHTLLCRLGFPERDALDAVRRFSGVWRRFDFAGRFPCGAAVYDDYAHNVEKVQSAILTAQAVSRGRVFAVFQPHGFAPMRFMRDELLRMLQETLHAQDVFLLMPVYYAGGTASFHPTSEEVAEAWYKAGADRGRILQFAGREAAETYLRSAVRADDLILIAGGRDNSLSLWAKNLCFRT